MKTKVLTLLSLLIIMTINLFSQQITWDWTNSSSGSGSTKASRISIDNEENIYIMGRFSDTLIYQTDSLFAFTDNDMFIAKFDSSGNYIWSKQIMTKNGASTGDLVADSVGNIYITTSYSDTIFFEGDTLAEGGIVAKINQYGDLIWKREISSSQAVFCYSVDIDDSGYVYLGGNFNQDVQIDTVSEVTQGDMYSTMMLFAKLDTSGSCIFIKTALLDDMGMYGLSDMDVDIKGNAYIMGTLTLNVDFGNGAYITHSGMLESPFVAKYNKDGVCQWAKEASALLGEGNDLCYDNNNGVYMTGMYLNQIEIDTFVVGAPMSANQEIFVIKLDTSGVVQYLNSYGSINDGGEYCISFSAKPNGEAYILGMFGDTIILNTDTLVAVGVPSSAIGSDIFIAKLDSAGIPIWGKRAGLTGEADFGELLVNENDMLYIAGYVFDNAGTKALGDQNAFVAKFGNNSIITNVSHARTENLDINIYPNPAGDYFYMEKSCNEDCLVEIYDITGSLIYQQPISNQKEKINLSHIKRGIYIVAVSNKSIVSTQKLIVE